MVRSTTSWICCLALLLSSIALPQAGAEETNPVKRPTVTKKSHKALDVTIKDGTINGKLVDGSGNPQASARLIARRNDHDAIAVKTDSKGSFKLKGVRPGVYSIAFGNRSALLRAWDAEVAPPAAKPAVLLVSGDIERGQLTELNPLNGSFTAQTFAIGILTAAVAVPVAIGLDEPSGS